MRTCTFGSLREGDTFYLEPVEGSFMHKHEMVVVEAAAPNKLGTYRIVDDSTIYTAGNGKKVRRPVVVPVSTFSDRRFTACVS